MDKPEEDGKILIRWIDRGANSQTGFWIEEVPFSELKYHSIGSPQHPHAGAYLHMEYEHKRRIIPLSAVEEIVIHKNSPEVAAKISAWRRQQAEERRAEVEGG